MLFLGIMSVTTSCNKVSDFGNTNVDQDNAVVPVTKTLLTGVLSGMGGVPSNTNPGFYTQYFSETIYPGNQQYAVTSVDWGAFYTGALEDLQQIIATCQKFPNTVSSSGNTTNQIQIARILKVYTFSIITDRYGDIPYSAALTGATPVPYDKQKDIYTDFFKELKSAKNSFDPSGSAIAGDIVYGGDLSKWKKLANSLRLIYAMRLSKVDPVKGKAEFLDALGDVDGVMSSNADNFTLAYPGGSFNNPNANLTGASVFAISKLMADKLNGYGDPRVYSYGKANASNIVKGVPFGLNSANLAAWITANPDWSSAYGTAQKQVNSPIVIIPVAYIELLRAEAAVDPNYATGENSQALVQSAIQHSWSQWGTSGGNISNYLLTINATANPVSKAVIDEQMWIALYGSTQNAWNEWRRTGIPALSPAPDAINESHTIPRRYQYPLTEVNLNAPAYAAAIAAFPYGGTDVHNNRVWWDKP